MIPWRETLLALAEFAVWALAITTCFLFIIIIGG